MTNDTRIPKTENNAFHLGDRVRPVEKQKIGTVIALLSTFAVVRWDTKLGQPSFRKEAWKFDRLVKVDAP